MEQEIGIEVGGILKYRYRGLVKEVAKIMGITASTAYDYAEGKIKPTLAFIKAAFLATDGDPDIAALLEPAGWRLVQDGDLPKADAATLAEELIDDLPALARFHDCLRDPACTKREAEKTMNAAIKELRQNLSKWLEDRC